MLEPGASRHFRDCRGARKHSAGSGGCRQFWAAGPGVGAGWEVGQDAALGPGSDVSRLWQNDGPAPAVCTRTACCGAGSWGMGRGLSQSQGGAQGGE